MTTVLGIDPGPTLSAYSLIDARDCRPLRFGKVENGWLLSYLDSTEADAVALEMIASYGMPVGVEVFDTCVWIGRFCQRLYDRDVWPQLVKRQPVKLHHCLSAKANDASVRQALVDRFAPGQPNHGKGTKVAPGWFHSFAADVWQSYALAVYVADQGVAR